MLLSPICKIVSDARNIEARGKSGIEFLGEMLRNNPRETMQIVAVLNGQDPDKYQCDGASALLDVMELATDPDLMALFGLRRQTQASSGPAQENTKATHP